MGHQRVTRACMISVILITLVLVANPQGTFAGSGPIVSHLSREVVRDLRVGVSYSGGTRVRSPFFGFSFVVPAQWQAKLPAGTTVFLDSPVKPGLGLVHMLTDISEAEVEAKLNEPLAIEATLILHPVTMVKKEGRRLSAAYVGGTHIGRTVALIGPERSAVVYQFIGLSEEASGADQFLEQLAGTTKFLDPQTTHVLKRWYDQLGGMMLKRRSPEGLESVGNGKEATWHLCEDGRFVYSLPEATSEAERDATGHPKSEIRETGEWRVELIESHPELVLTLSYGSQRTYKLQMENELHFLDGTVVERSRSHECF